MQSGEFTANLARFRAGDAQAEHRLIGVLYADLKRLARRHISGSRWVATLDTTALLHESYLRLVGPAAREVESRAHFLNLASRVMRQVICDYARRRLRLRERVDVGVDTEVLEHAHAALTQAREIVSLDDALVDLASVSQRQADVIECRFFAGLSEDETALALEISVRTVQRDWQLARAWLAEHLAA